MMQQQEPVGVQEELHLVAFDPAGMQAAQQHLLEWTKARASKERRRAGELSQNLQIATRNKWKVSTLRNALAHAKGRAMFFNKLSLAVQEGYYIIPDLPMDTFVVRSKLNVPSHRSDSNVGEPGQVCYRDWNIPNEKPRALPACIGENRNPEPLVRHHESSPFQKNGKTVISKTTTASAWADEIDFPFTLAKPEVLEATDRAMRLKIFDEIGVLPQTAKKDPMVIGRIIGPKRLNASFLIAWFLDEEHFS